MKRVFLGAVLALGIGASVPALAGPTLTFNLTVDGCSPDNTGCGGPGPYGTIVVSQSTTNASQVVVTETLAPNVQFTKSGAGQALEFSLQNFPSLSFSNLTTGFVVGPSPATASAFGTFDYSITCSSCGSGGSDPNPGPLSFVLAASNGGAVVDLTPESFIPSVNSSNNPRPTIYFFASDVIDGTSGNVAALRGTLATVPEPMSMALLGAGLVGMTMLRRKQTVS